MKKQNAVKMTYDIVFKKFFTDKPKILKLVLKHFLEIDSISEITITNPEIPALEERKQKKGMDGNKNKVENKKQEEKQKEELKRKTIGELNFLDSSLPSENIDGKRVFLDLRVKLSSGENINVEMQSYYEKNFLNRILYYWAKLHSQNLKKGEAYSKITPTYSLIFTEQPFLDKTVKDFISSFSIRKDKKPYILFNKDLKIVIVELSKLNKSRSNLLDFKELWCYFIRKSDKLTKGDREYLSRYKELEEAMEHFDKLSKEEKIQSAVLDKWRNEMFNILDKSGWIEFGEERGIKKGIKKGIEKGRQEGLLKVAVKMLKKNSEISFIEEVTGFSKNEILELKNKKKKSRKKRRITN